ncbi:MAG: NAD(P)/FAD-dependent oxidoreductase [Candidatus Omnitrophica bacterium]|nr:NAD(P)/FAD-dependent oxidoreductase [Candidatus Omnitrophota bacterium]
MAKVVIIGDSAAGFSAVQELCAKGAGAFEPVVISRQEQPPYKKSMFADFLSRAAEEKALFLCAADFYARQKIETHKPAEVARVDVKKQRVALKDNSKIPYDYLLIASGSQVKLPDIPGTGKDGVFALDSLERAREIRLRLDLAPVVCLSGSAAECLALSRALHKAREIKIVSTPKPDSFVSDERVEWIEEAGFTEIIGEGSELKAVKLAGGKAIGTSLVIFSGPHAPRTAFLKESGIRLDPEGYVLVDERLRTNVENIFSCGSACRKEGAMEGIKSWEAACAEGAQAAVNLVSLERGVPSCQQTS